MEAILWGVRGSIPHSGPANRYYGANTACVELRLPHGGLLVFDAGTGIRSLGETLPDSGEAHICIGHGHTDHVQGLNFFRPLYLPGWTVHLYLPDSDQGMLGRIFDGDGFPITVADLKADIRQHALDAGTVLDISVNGQDVRLETFATNHPGGGIAYAATYGGERFCYTGDHEISADPAILARTEAMLRGADVAVVDAVWNRNDRIIGWGHSVWEDWLKPAREAGVGTLVFTHHFQDRTDADLDALAEEAGRREAADADGPHLVIAREGARIPLGKARLVKNRPSNWLERFTKDLSRYKEESVLLDRILHKAREITGADAGTIYLAEHQAEGGDLVFAYAQNNTLNPPGSANRSAYVNLRLPLSTASIAGYTAATGESLNLADVYAIPPDVPYRFNDSFDRESGYRTRSVMTVPLTNRQGRVLGVIQLINSISPADGAVQPFTPRMKSQVELLAREAAGILELGYAVRDTIIHLLRIAILHDPYETGAHAERVGSLAAEVYQRWADKQGLPPEKVRHYKGQLRLAAMLHDIGKIGVSESVLKKPGKLTDEEFVIMKNHARYGAELFLGDNQDMMEMAREISLHHHQKWNGKGYPLLDEGPKAGEDIPLSARITAIADVFDALVSPRCYKNAWTVEKASNLLREEAGQHFDPELVDCFLELEDVVPMIYRRFPDKREVGDGNVS